MESTASMSVRNNPPRTCDLVRMQSLGFYFGTWAKCWHPLPSLQWMASAATPAGSPIKWLFHLAGGILQHTKITTFTP